MCNRHPPKKVPNIDSSVLTAAHPSPGPCRMNRHSLGLPRSPRWNLAARLQRRLAWRWPSRKCLSGATGAKAAVVGSKTLLKESKIIMYKKEILKMSAVYLFTAGDSLVKSCKSILLLGSLGYNCCFWILSPTPPSLVSASLAQLLVFCHPYQVRPKRWQLHPRAKHRMHQRSSKALECPQLLPFSV